MKIKTSSELAPIILFTYNRPWHTKQTILALQKNELASVTELIIFSDGPKNEDTIEKVEAVRQYLKTIVGFKRVIINIREKNFGLANNIIDGVTKTIEEYGKVIVLEDDLITSPYFLRFVNDALFKYENEPKVISVSSFIYPVKKEIPETFFLKGADCLGWATWKRGWDLFEKDGLVLLKELKKYNLMREFDFNNSYPYSKMLIDQIDGKVGSWAIRWYASAFLKNKLTLYPGRSLVFHNGSDGSGTNCGIDNIFDVEISQTPIKVFDSNLIESLEGRKAFEGFFLEMKGSFYSRVIRKWNSIVLFTDKTGTKKSQFLKFYLKIFLKKIFRSSNFLN